MDEHPGSVATTPNSHSPRRATAHSRQPRVTRPAVESLRTGRCVALVDARFWAWLKDTTGADLSPVPEGLLEELQGMVHSAGPETLTRILWYTDDTRRNYTPGVSLRMVVGNSTDGGLNMLRQMSSDLSDIARSRGFDRVVIVSDDERLTLSLDQVQMSGVEVDMVIDPDAQDLEALREEDPSWARLLGIADRHLVLGAWRNQRSMARDRYGNNTRGNREDAAAPSAESAALIDAEIADWWSCEGEPQREHWLKEVQSARGVPQELDRDLLLRISRRLGQALSPAEKSAMRHRIRQTVLGVSSEAAAPAGEIELSAREL